MNEHPGLQNNDSQANLVAGSMYLEEEEQEERVASQEDSVRAPASRY